MYGSLHRGFFPVGHTTQTAMVKILRGLSKLRKATVSFVKTLRPSVRPALMKYLCSQWTEFHEICNSHAFRKSVEKIQVSLKSGKIHGALQEDQYIFFIIQRSFLLTTRNTQTKSCRENQNTHSTFNNFLFSKIVFFMRVVK